MDLINFQLLDLIEMLVWAVLVATMHHVPRMCCRSMRWAFDLGVDVDGFTEVLHRRLWLLLG